MSEKKQSRMPAGKKFINKFNTVTEKYNIKDFVEAEGIEVRSPINGELLGCFNENSKEDLLDKIKVLKEAQLKWKNYPAPQRGELIRQFGNAIREAKNDLSTMITLENGKIYQESLGEIQEVIDICDFAVGLSRQLYGLTMPSERQDHRMQEMWNPYGIVGVVTAFNFPAAVFSWNFAIASVGGNAVIWKPSPKTPFISIMLKAIWDKTCEDAEVDWAKDILAMYMGANTQAEDICHNKDIRVVSLTGSSDMGRKLGPIVQERFGKLISELGGNNAMIVTPNANQKLALKSILFSAVGTAGQRCTTLRRLIVHNSIKEKFVKMLVKYYGTVRTGDPFEKENLIGPLITHESLVKMQEVLEHCRQKGHTVHGGAPLTQPYYIMKMQFNLENKDLTVDDMEKQNRYVAPAIVDLASDDDIVKQETFAPILYVMGYDDLDEAIALQNDVPQGLSSCIFTDNLKEAERFIGANGSDCGIVNINIGPSGAEIGGAFGGEKETGGGRESGSDAWKQYMKRSTVTINYGDDLPLAQGVSFDV
jgi:aldehyde dehydrogenase (NAD+)